MFAARFAKVCNIVEQIGKGGGGRGKGIAKNHCLETPQKVGICRFFFCHALASYGSVCRKKVLCNVLNETKKAALE